MHPIWLRKEVTLGTGSDYEFYIMHGAAEIYRGHAYKRPGAAAVTVVLNDIVRDYLHALPASGSVAGSPYTAIATPAVGTFSTYLADGTLMNTATFIMDWSYDAARAEALAYFPDAVVLEDPIVPVWAAGLPLLVTTTGAREFTDGEDSVAADGPAVFTFPATGEAVTITDTESGVERTLPVRKLCGEWYALYYLNAYGGWDQLVCDGWAMRSHSYLRRTITHEADNALSGIVAERRGVHAYGASAEQRWQLSTPFLTDDQSARMHHLIGSREVWLVAHDAPSTFQPVTVETESVEVKTHGNQEGGMVAYAFTVKLAEERQR